jgi:hypothetical protein
LCQAVTTAVTRLFQNLCPQCRRYSHVFSLCTGHCSVLPAFVLLRSGKLFFDLPRRQQSTARRGCRRKISALPQLISGKYQVCAAPGRYHLSIAPPRRHVTVVSGWGGDTPQPCAAARVAMTCAAAHGRGSRSHTSARRRRMKVKTQAGRTAPGIPALPVGEGLGEGKGRGSHTPVARRLAGGAPTDRCSRKACHVDGFLPYHTEPRR